MLGSNLRMWKKLEYPPGPGPCPWVGLEVKQILDNIKNAIIFFLTYYMYVDLFSDFS